MRVASSFTSRGGRYVWVNASNNARGQAIVQRIVGPTGRWTPVRVDSLGTTYRVINAHGKAY